MVKKWANTNLGPTDHNANDNASMNMALQNHTRELITGAIVYGKDKKDVWGEAFIDADGRNNSYLYGGALFSTDKYVNKDWTSEPHVVIVATSLTTSDFAINNCVCQKLAVGRWVLYCTSGTNEVKRAQIYKTLFYGSDGTNARIKNTYITGITALKTSVSRDVGKRAYYLTLTASAASGYQAAYYTATFADTTNNTACSTWSSGTHDGLNNYRAYWEMPSGSELANLDNADFTGTDTSAQELNNPATARIKVNRINGSSGSTATGKVFILCYGTASFAYSTSAGTFTHSESNIDFYTAHSVPLMTATDLTATNITYLSIPTGTILATCSSLHIKALVATAGTIRHKIVNATEDSGWCNDGESINFTAFTGEPTILEIETSTTAAIYGVSIYAE